MSFVDYLRYIKHMTIEEYNQLSLGAKMVLETEYELAYGMDIGVPD